MNAGSSRHKIEYILILILILTLVSFAIFTILQQPSGESSIKFTLADVVKDLEVPWSIAFSNDGSMLFTERPGRVDIFKDNSLIKLNVSGLDVTASGEGGLLGIALDPNFTSNSYVYLYYTYSNGSNLFNRVVRYKLVSNSLVDPIIIIDRIPGGFIHDGGRIKFGNDGMLYIATGDGSVADRAQRLDSLSGKILRLKPDGTVPKDNPFPSSPVYTYGHRNPQGINWNPYNGVMYESEHGPVAHDEINIIVKGGNYGWPVVTGVSNDTRFINPIIESNNTTWAPSGIAYCKCEKYPSLANSLLIATLRGESLLVLKLDNTGTKVTGISSLFKNELGRIRDVVIGPDGSIYLSTSNRDGRGIPRQGDDRILRIIEDDNSNAVTQRPYSIDFMIQSISIPSSSFSHLDDIARNNWSLKDHDKDIREDYFVI